MRSVCLSFTPQCNKNEALDEEIHGRTALEHEDRCTYQYEGTNSI